MEDHVHPSAADYGALSSTMAAWSLAVRQLVDGLRPFCHKDPAIGHTLRRASARAVTFAMLEKRFERLHQLHGLHPDTVFDRAVYDLFFPKERHSCVLCCFGGDADLALQTDTVTDTDDDDDQQNAPQPIIAFATKPRRQMELMQTCIDNLANPSGGMCFPTAYALTLDSVIYNLVGTLRVYRRMYRFRETCCGLHECAGVSPHGDES